MTTPEGAPHDGASDDGTTKPARRGLTAGMRYTLYAVAVVVIVGLVVSISLLFTPGAGTTDAGGSASASGTPTRGPVPGATPTTGSEVQSPAPTQTEANRIPQLPTPAPLVAAPLPASASAEGLLVDGFPTDVMGPADGSDVVSSSIATEGDTMQVTLVARTDAVQDDVVAHYRLAWSALGLTENGQVDASAAASYADGFTTLSLAFPPSSGTGTIYMIYGVFRTS